MSAYTPHTSARATDPHTSHQAAYAAASFAGTHCKQILDALKAHGPLNPEQIAAMVGMDGYQCRKRLSDLQKIGKAEPTGELARTKSGRSQRIWRAL